MELLMPDSKECSKLLDPSDTFIDRHIGPGEEEIAAMLAAIGSASLDHLVEETIPPAIRLARGLKLGGPRGEHELIQELRAIAGKNRVLRSLLGMGYYGCITPPIIQRNILENPGWYTQYTPYQAEIAQGRLEALLNFQTMVADLTALPLANASLLDEATAAAEAMHMCRAIAADGKHTFLVAADCHPQTIAVVKTRSHPLGVKVVVAPPREMDFTGGDVFGVLLQYPTTDGRVCDDAALVERAHSAGALAVVATDLLALTLLRPPGEFGADIAVGSAQRFGVSMGFGGPHAAFMSARDEHKRQMPGRIVGVSTDVHGRPACRLAIQTREQHIRREKATSNICTAQVLLAIMAGMYAVYHGPGGLRRIACRVHAFTAALAAGLRKLGHALGEEPFFDTLRVRPAAGGGAAILAAARARGFNLRDFGDGSIGLSLDERTDRAEVAALLEVFNGGRPVQASPDDLLAAARREYPAPLARQSAYLAHPVFNTHHSETELLRYLFTLQSRDLSLAHSMIPLGSCTMKLNATSEMLPVTWPAFADLHPFAPPEQAAGYAELFDQLEAWLAEITGFDRICLQPNAGSQGEYAGLLVIRAWHEAAGQGRRDVCLIPQSAHGTNPASAAVAGLRVVVVACDAGGNIDVEDLARKAREHADRLCAFMVTYPSTHGVFEERIREICGIVHQHGGQVYMDGANMNAQVGHRRRRLPPQPAQDLLHSARRRRPGHGTDRRGPPPGAVPPRAPGRAPQRSGGAGHRPGLGGALWQPQHLHHLVGLHRPDGRRGPDPCDAGLHPQRQLHGPPAGGALPCPLRRSWRPRGPRVHHRRPAAGKIRRRAGGGHRQAPDGLRLSRPDDLLPRPRDPDDRADGERIQGRTRPLLRRPHRHPAGDPGHRGGSRRPGR
jgi:glycine dehydrogenase